MSLKKCLLAALGFLASICLSAQGLQTAYEKALKIKDKNQRITTLIQVFETHDDSEPLGSVLRLKVLNEIETLSESSNHAMGLMAANFYLGNEYNGLNDLIKSIERYILCQKYAEQFGNNYYLSRGLMGIGLIHYKQERWNAAYKLFERSLSVSRNLKDKSREGTQLYLCGLCLGRLNQYEKSLLLLDSALYIFKNEKKTEAELEARLGIAYSLRNTGQLDSAENLYLEAQSELEEGNLHDVYARILIETGLGEVAFARNRIPLALAHGLKAEQGLKVDSYGSWIHLDVYNLLIRIYQNSGDYKRAMLYHERRQKLQDTARNWDAGVLAVEQQTLFDFEKKQALLKEQFRSELVSQKKTRLGLLILAAVMLALAVVILLAYRAVSKQRRLSEKLLLNILPAETANELKKYGAAIPKKHKEVAILFADIKGFTHIAEKLPPENIVKKLDDFFSRFDEIMIKYGLEKIKTIGDAYMAVAGLNGSSDNPSLAAVKAAWAVTEAVKKMNARYPSTEVPFSFRIGINTGPVISGVVGKNKYSYDIWGDSVNVAARMEQSSHPGSINISGETWNQVKHAFECTYRGKVAAKNKGQIDMYYVDEVK